MRATSTKAGGTTNGADHFAPRIIVGNVPAGDPATDQIPPFQYIHDPGDGSGVAAALAVAVAGYDIYVRPGTYDFGSGVVATPLTIPAGVTLHGEPGAILGGASGTVLRARTGSGGETQDLFVLGAGAALENVLIQVPAASGQAAGGNAIVEIPNVGIRISGVLIDMTFGGSGQRKTTFAIGTGPAAAPCTADILENIEVLMPFAESTGLPYVAMFLGALGVDSTAGTSFGPQIRDCIFTGGQGGVIMASISGGEISRCNHYGIICSQFSSMAFAWILQVATANVVRGPRMIGNTVFGSNIGDAPGAELVGYTISNDTTTGTHNVTAPIVDGCRVIFATVTDATQRALRILIGNNGVGQLSQGIVTGFTSVGHEVGIQIDTNTNDNTASTTIGAINDWTFTGCNVAVPTGPAAPQGILLDIANFPAQPKINRISIVGCDASQAPAGGIGVVVNVAGVTDTIVSSTQLTPNGGTDMLDFGTGTERIGTIP